MLSLLKNWLVDVSAVDPEAVQLLKFIDGLGLKPGARILDVGCGYGRRLALLKKHGLAASGVDVDPQALEQNRKAGFDVCHADELKPVAGGYDLILMSHVIEHFTPERLLVFMEHYLDLLRKGGNLIICTPLLTAAFFNDFDHVKPYHPTGLQMMFCESGSQLQYHARNRLRLLGISFTKSPLRLEFSATFFVPGSSRLPFYLNLMLRLAHRLSFGLLSQKNAWTGLYEKLG